MTTDDALDQLRAARARWAGLPIATKVGYLDEIARLVAEHARSWVQAGAAFKGLPEDHPLIGGEEWLAGPYATLAWLQDAARTLRALDQDTDPLRGLPVTTNASDRVSVQVMPSSLLDRVLLNGYQLHVTMQDGVTPDNLRHTLGAFYRQPHPPGRVTLVLGAGNVSSIPILDTLYVMFVRGDVVLLKTSPIGEAYRPILESVLQPLVADGFLRIVAGDASAGHDLANDNRIDAIHLTGSSHTYNAIVWGTGPDAEQRRQRGERLCTKPITAELGGVAPTIVVPGQWSDADLRYQAAHIATQRLYNSGHACIASQILVLPKSWPQRAPFVDELRRAFERAPQRDAFYPGTDERVEAFLTENPDAERISGHQPRALLVGINPEADHQALHEEMFGPIYLTVDLPGSTPKDYLRNAVTFANEKLSGDLSANVIMDPTVQRHLGLDYQRALDDLRFGCVSVNIWTGVAFLVSRAAWGALPGNTALDIQSGTGFVHNSLMFDRPEKNVMVAPFRPFPRALRHGEFTLAVPPPWFLSSRHGTEVAEQLTYLLADGKLSRLPPIVLRALAG